MSYATTEFPKTQQEWLKYASKEELIAFVCGSCIYDANTRLGEQVFTLRNARKYSTDELAAVIDYMIMSDRVDIVKRGKATVSLGNILCALGERATPEELARADATWAKISAMFL